AARPPARKPRAHGPTFARRKDGWRRRQGRFFPRAKKRRGPRRRQSRRCGSEWGRAGDFACARRATEWDRCRRAPPAPEPIGSPGSCRRGSKCASRFSLRIVVMNAPWLTLIGLSEGGRENLSPAAIEALAQARLVV